MNIIIEGPDGGGKTTFAMLISDELGWQVIGSEGPPSNITDINHRALRAVKADGVIFDRHPVISNAIYDKFRERKMPIAETVTHLFNKQHNLVIYVPGLPTLHGHIAKEHDTPQHMALILDNHDKICKEYDTWAKTAAHLVITRDMQMAFLSVLKYVGFLKNSNGHTQARHRDLKLVSGTSAAG